MAFSRWARHALAGAGLTFTLMACLGRSEIGGGDEGSSGGSSFGGTAGSSAGSGGNAGTSTTGGNSGSSFGGSSGSNFGGDAGFGGSGGFGGDGGFGGNAGFGGDGGFGGDAGFGGDGGFGGDAGFGGSGAFGGSGGFGGNPDCGPCDGCCDPAGNCRPGTVINACGSNGADCLDCGPLGFDCINSTCQGVVPDCGPDTCDGCCDDQDVCRFGTETDACGFGGQACENCGAAGLGCGADGQCEGPPPSCGAASCGGCCQGDTCLPGTADSACGDAGESCQDCLASARECNQPGNYCAFIPTCGPATCPTGCCDSQGKCKQGRSDDVCGQGGQLCVDCTAQNGAACAPQGFCYQGQSCGPDNCAGCCTTNGQCRAGAGNANCGQFGNLCDNCNAKGQVCSGNVCTDGGACPTAFAGCAPGTNTTPPFTSTFCNDDLLDQLRAACQNPEGPECGEHFNRMLQEAPGCYDCILQFTGEGAYAKCLAPYLDADCNEALTCALRCSNDSCGDCPTNNQQEQCQDGLFAFNGVCQPWVNGFFCAEAALGGPGAFCDFESAGNAGEWWYRIGQRYCNQ